MSCLRMSVAGKAAAGGITTLEEVRELQRMNVHAALGMAIYTGRLSLEALAAE